MKAILSDIHGNLEALHAVLEDIHKHPVEAVYCLGDMVGYGPNPRECLELAMTWPVVLLGNHDEAAILGPLNFTPAAKQSLLWTSEQIAAALPCEKAAECRRAFLQARPQRHREGDFLFVHGSAYDPVSEYVFPQDVHNVRKMDRLFACVGRWCFQGHTHTPGVFTEALKFFTPREMGFEYRLDGKAMINVGSVGQPRDGDWRASYLLLDGETIRFQRVEYDIETTVRKIHAIPELPGRLGDRLRRGE